MSANLPPIVKLAERLMLEVERAVRAFPRYHKYSLGQELRQQCRDVVRLCYRAWRARDQQQVLLPALVEGVDDIKLSLQLGSQLRAFRSFDQFEALLRVALDLGRQAGGWRRQVLSHPKGQNPEPVPARERAHTLSTRSASTQGANA